MLRTYLSPGDRVLVDHPSYPNALQAIRAAHARPVPVPLLEDGWDHAGIEAALRQAEPKLAYLVVDFHNPTGLRLDVEGRRRLAALLRRHRMQAVVDETLVELDLEDDPLNGPPPLAAFDAEHVLLTGSAGKSFWGGLRLGWIRAPEETIRRFVAARPAMDLGSPLFEQLVLIELLADQESVLARRRREFAEQRDALVMAVCQHLPGWGLRECGIGPYSGAGVSAAGGDVADRAGTAPRRAGPVCSAAESPVSWGQHDTGANTRMGGTPTAVAGRVQPLRASLRSDPARADGPDDFDPL